MNKIYISGHRGMVGSALVRKAKELGGFDTITTTRSELDLCNQAAVFDFLAREKPDTVVIAAAKVGGIHANSTYPADFIYENLAIAANLVEGSRRASVPRVLFLGSSCIYPKLAPQPMTEDCLLTSALEQTNEAYAIAKIAGIKMCESYNRQYGESHGIDYRSVIPTNLYGPGDNYHFENSHVIPALIRRFHEAKVSKAKEAVIWGSGKPHREFLYVDDMAKASVFVMGLAKDQYDQVASPMQGYLNVGFGSDVTIFELSSLVAKVINYQGKIVFNSSKPDGSPRKLLSSVRINQLGWRPECCLEDGLRKAYHDFFSKTQALLKNE